MTRARQRPKDHDDREAFASAEDIHESSAAEIHQPVGQEKGRVEKRLHLVRDGLCFSAGVGALFDHHHLHPAALAHFQSVGLLRRWRSRGVGNE